VQKTAGGELTIDLRNWRAQDLLRCRECCDSRSIDTFVKLPLNS
jgi:hypothetical protein